MDQTPTTSTINDKISADIWPYLCKLKKLFEYYCQFGNRMNLDTLGCFHFIKLLKDCKILTSNYAFDANALSKTDLEIIYKSENKSNTMSFNDFLNCIVKIAYRKFPEVKDKKKRIFQLINTHFIPLYDNLFSQNELIDHNTSSIVEIKNVDEALNDQNIQAMIIRTAPIFFDIYCVYFNHEISICDNIQFIKDKSLKQYFIFLRDFGICPGMISKPGAFQIYQSETSNDEIDKNLNENKKLYFKLIKKIDLERIIKLEGKNLNILGQFFNFFKFLRSLIKFADFTYRTVGIKTREAEKYNETVKTISDKFNLFLKKIEKTPGFIELEKKTSKTHSLRNVQLSFDLNELKENNSKTKRSVSYMKLTSRQPTTRKKNDIVLGRSFNPDSSEGEVNLIVYHNNYNDLCENIDYIKEKYGRELTEIFIGICQFGDKTNRKYLKSNKWYKFLKECKLIKKEKRRLFRSKSSGNSKSLSYIPSSPSTIAHPNHLLRNNEIDTIFTKLANMPLQKSEMHQKITHPANPVVAMYGYGSSRSLKELEPSFCLTKEGNYSQTFRPTTTLSSPTAFKVQSTNASLFIPFSSFLIAIEIIAQIVYSALPTKEGIDAIVIEHIFPNMKKYKINQEVANAKVEYVLDYERNQGNKELIKNVQISLKPLFKFYTSGSDVMVFEQVLTFTKDFELFPDILNYNFFNEVFHILSEQCNIFENIEAIDLKRFSSFIFLCAFELKYPEEEITDDEKVLFIIDKFSLSKGMDKLVQKNNSSIKKVGKGDNWNLNDNLKKLYPERYRKVRKEKETFINIFS